MTCIWSTTACTPSETSQRLTPQRFNIRWLLRAIATKGLVALLFAFSQLALYAACIVTAPQTRALATARHIRQFERRCRLVTTRMAMT